MSLIKKPAELEPKRTISALIFGEPGVGKSTLGCSAPNAVLFDYDGGVQRINAAHRIPTVQISSWEQTQEALQEIDAEMPECQTIVIDTVGKMLDHMSAYIIKNNYKMGQSDGSLSLKGYGVRKVMFQNFVKQLAVSGRNVIFIAHEREEKRGEETVKRPEIGGSSANDLIKELDLVGYMRARGKKRILTFNPTDEYYAKNTCNLPEFIEIPVTVDENGTAVGENNYISRIINAFGKSQLEQRAKSVKFEEIMKGFRETIAEVENVDDANKVLAIFNDEATEHILNSKVVALNLLARKAATIGAKYDKITKKFVA